MQHTDVDYAEIFYQIEETLRNQSTLMREEFDRRFGKFSYGGYRVKTDNDIFRVLVYIPYLLRHAFIYCHSKAAYNQEVLVRFQQGERLFRGGSGSNVERSQYDPS